MNPVELEIAQLPYESRAQLEELRGSDPDLFVDLSHYPIESRTSTLKAMALWMEHGMPPRLSYLLALADAEAKRLQAVCGG